MSYLVEFRNTPSDKQPLVTMTSIMIPEELGPVIQRALNLPPRDMVRFGQPVSGWQNIDGEWKEFTLQLSGLELFDGHVAKSVAVWLAHALEVMSSKPDTFLVGPVDDRAHDLLVNATTALQDLLRRAIKNPQTVVQVTH